MVQHLSRAEGIVVKRHLIDKAGEVQIVSRVNPALARPNTNRRCAELDSAGDSRVSNIHAVQIEVSKTIWLVTNADQMLPGVAWGDGAVCIMGDIDGVPN